MTQVISATFTRFDRMSPTAAALAVLLHVVAALALWWSASLNEPDPDEHAIEVTIEQPKPQPQPTPPPTNAKPVPPPTPPAPPMPAPAPAARPASPAPAPAAHVPFGLPSPSPTTAEKTEQTAPKGDPVKTPPTEPPKPDTQVEEKPPTPEPQQPPQQAMAPPQPAPVSPVLERALPPVDTPQAPLTSKDFPRPAPPPPPAKPQTRPAPQPGPQPQLRPSPLSQFQQKNAPAGDTRNNSASATFVNPAAQAAKTRLIEQYTFQLIQRIAQYRPYLKEQNLQGSVIVRLVLSTDGRLIDASISSSSGLPDLDKALMEAVRAASPYPPIPPGITSGGQGAFLLPLGFRPN